MKLEAIKLKNFRGYKEEIEIKIGNLIAFVGKNDIGKSTILEALDIFFNDKNAIVKIDSSDVNKSALQENDKETIISAIFSDLPEKIIIDTTNETSFDEEYLLNADGKLEIVKKYSNGGSAKIFIRAFHPTNSNCSDLLLKKNKDYKDIITKNNITCDNLVVNAIMRKSIWRHFSEDLRQQEILIDTSKEDAKNIWEKIQPYLPIYTLFQSDRKNSDGDSEVQDPLKLAVQQVFSEQELRQEMERIYEKVVERLKSVSEHTLEKLNEMNPDVASSLSPIIPSLESLKWADVFKNVSICGDNDIPINKRGSGIKRLVLLNFFRAEAERRRERDSQSIIYAVEEPETSQHYSHQKLLIKAFLELSNQDNTQVILTTHSATVVKELKFDNLRLISENGDNKVVSEINPNGLPYPSLNEINYVAFGELTEEYHNELYGYIEAENLKEDYKKDKIKIPYKRISNKKLEDEEVTLTEYIRHQIHHPENKHNDRFTFDQLIESVDMMRDFIIEKRAELS